MDLMQAMEISGAGMRVQGARMRVISQNMANADTAANTPEEEPYKRKTITFENELNKASGIDKVKVKNIGEDDSDFKMVYKPGHPGADEDGMVKMPNVNPLLEMMDMREAQRSYEANLGAIRTSRGMIQQTINMIGGN